MHISPRVFTTALLAAPVFPPAIAQQDGSEALDTITVLATRTERSLDELASTVSVKTADDFERELAQDIADIVRFEPGVTVAGTGSRFGLTGFNIRGIGGNRVLTLIDGVRVPEEFSFGPFLSARRDYVDIDSLSRAEIARGPISSLYGSDALGGVVALSTRHPRDYLGPDRGFSGAFKGGYSGVDKSSAGTLSLAGRAGPTAGILHYTGRAGGETSNAGVEGGHGPGRELPDPQDIDVGNLTAKLAFSPSEANEFILGVDAYENDIDTRILSDYGISVYGTTVNTRDAEDARRRSRWTLAYRHTGRLPVADRVQATVYQQDSRSEQLTLEGRTTPARASQTRRRHSLYEQEIHGAWIQIDKSFDLGAVGNLVTYGADYYVTDNASVRDGGTLDASGNPVREFSPLPTRDFPVTKVTQVAAYLQDELTLLGGDLLVSPSVRFDRFEATTQADSIYLNGNPGTKDPEGYEDSQVTAKLGAVYSFTGSVSAYGRYSEGFRAPPYDDVNVGFTNFLGGYKTIANPDLESERQPRHRTRRAPEGRGRPRASGLLPQRLRAFHRILRHCAPVPPQRRHRPGRRLAHVSVRQPGLGANQRLGIGWGVRTGLRTDAPSVGGLCLGRRPDHGRAAELHRTAEWGRGPRLRRAKLALGRRSHFERGQREGRSGHRSRRPTPRTLRLRGRRPDGLCQHRRASPAPWRAFQPGRQDLHPLDGYGRHRLRCADALHATGIQCRADAASGAPAMIVKQTVGAAFLSCALHHTAIACGIVHDSSRIAVAGGSLTEIIYFLGAEERVVAVDLTSTHPADAMRRFPSVGYVRSLSVEGLLSLEPTLVLGEHDMGPPEVLAQLERTGVEVVRVPEEPTATGIIDKIRCVAAALNLAERAKQLIETELAPRIEALEVLRMTATRKPSVALLLQISAGAPIGAGLGTSGDGLLQMVQASNALSGFSGWKPVAPEAMARADPDYILMTDRGLAGAGGMDALLANPALAVTSAVRDEGAGRLVVMEGMAMLGFGPRTLAAALELADRLHGPIPVAIAPRD